MTLTYYSFLFLFITLFFLFVFFLDETYSYARYQAHRNILFHYACVLRVCSIPIFEVYSVLDAHFILMLMLQYNGATQHVNNMFYYITQAIVHVILSYNKYRISHANDHCSCDVTITKPHYIYDVIDVMTSCFDKMKVRNVLFLQRIKSMNTHDF